jgi:hypothetical protein
MSDVQQIEAAVRKRDRPSRITVARDGRRQFRFRNDDAQLLTSNF